MGAFWGVPSAPQQHQECSQGRPGALQGAPWSVWERAEATKIEAETHMGWKTVSFWHAARSRSVVQAMFYRVFSILCCFAEPANPLKSYACQQKRRFGPVRSESSRPRHGTSKNCEKHQKPKPKSTTNRRKWLVGLTRAALPLNFGRSRDFERAVRGGQARSKRPERASQSAQARPGLRASARLTSPVG